MAGKSHASVEDRMPWDPATMAGARARRNAAGGARRNAAGGADVCALLDSKQMTDERIYRDLWRIEPSA
jgi:hypothetical protein